MHEDWKQFLTEHMEQIALPGTDEFRMLRRVQFCGNARRIQTVIEALHEDAARILRKLYDDLLKKASMQRELYIDLAALLDVDKEVPERYKKYEEHILRARQAFQEELKRSRVACRTCAANSIKSRFVQQLVSNIQHHESTT